LPLIAVPTTAGSGSEQTRATVIADPAADTKLAIYDDALLPATAIVDYELSITQPRALTAHVGLDALVHAIEAYVSRLATPLSDVLALEAARLVWPNLRAAVERPEDRAARAAMMLGSSLAGAAFSNSSVCLVHGMSRPLGAQFHIEHGLSNAILLDVVTRFSVPGAPDRYAQFARALDLAPAGASEEAANEALLSALDELVTALEIPTLSSLGVTREALERVADAMAAAALASGSPGFNPRQPDHDEIVALFREVHR
ncbi:MAG TPA: iron-containing alcohol dehydrogenase, partial [Conexibacter sp.]|nr:iron-containing alcohol dehydrogenase [Conexibacter sp.]